LNYSVFAWAISKSPGWRPTFKYYHPYLCVFAAFQSIVLMFLIDWIMALITVCVGAVCYKYIHYKQPNVNWGTTQQSALYLKGCKIALKYQMMNNHQIHAKIARPTFLIMLYDKNQQDVVSLFNLAKYINFGQGLIMIGHIIRGDLQNHIIQQQYKQKRTNYLNYDLNPDVIKQCIMECCVAENYENGTRKIMQLAGMGAMQPNVFMIKIDEDLEKMQDHTMDRKQPLWFTNLCSALWSGLGVIMIPNTFNLDSLRMTQTINDKNKNSKEQEMGFIDIWWLFDDGGLTILTGYLLTKYKEFKNYKLRIMALEEIGFQDHTEMVHLISKLRIDAEIIHVKSVENDHDDLLGTYSEINIEQDAKENAVENNEENKDERTMTIEEGVDDDNLNENNMDDEKIDNFKEKRRRKVSQFALGKMLKYKRVGDTIKKYSKESKLCLLSLPYPRNKFSWWEYSQIIHDLTPNDIPTIFVRGTQDQVLTFCF